MFNPVLVVRVRFLGDGPTKPDRLAVVDAINNGTNQDVCAVVSTEWESDSTEIVEIMAEHAHNEWMAANLALGITSRLSHWGEEQMVPYDELSERCQEFDRVIMRGILHGFANKGLVVREL